MKQKRKRNYTPCYCVAYPFPHRKGGGACGVPNMVAAVVERGGTISEKNAADWLYDYNGNIESAANAYMEDWLSVDEAAIRY